FNSIVFVSPSDSEIVDALSRMRSKNSAMDDSGLATCVVPAVPRSPHHHTSMTVPFADGAIAVRCFLRIAMTSATQPVHVGSMSITGRKSRTKVGRSRGWKPSSDHVMPAATTSRISSANGQPNGPRANCSTSVVTATPYAPQMRCFVNTGGAKRENVRSTESPNATGADRDPVKPDTTAARLVAKIRRSTRRLEAELRYTDHSRSLISVQSASPAEHVE